MADFLATVDAWIAESKALTEAVFKESVQDVISEMQKPVAAGGNMPVDTGYLRASIQVSSAEPVPINPLSYPVGSEYTYSVQQTTVGILGAQLGGHLYVTYTAAYAAHQNYGTSSMQGRHFVELAAQLWSRIVAKNCTTLRSQFKKE